VLRHLSFFLEYDVKEEDQSDVNVWEDNWDDDTVEDDFSVQLRLDILLLARVDFYGTRQQTRLNELRQQILILLLLARLVQCLWRDR